MADFLQGWLAGGASRGSREAQLYANDSAIQRAFAERQAKKKEADARIARALGLTDSAGAGDTKAQMELAAMGLGDTPQQQADKAAAAQATQGRFEQDFGLREESLRKSGEEFDQRTTDIATDRKIRTDEIDRKGSWREEDLAREAREREEARRLAALNRSEDIANRNAQLAREDARIAGSQDRPDMVAGRKAEAIRQAQEASRAVYGLPVEGKPAAAPAGQPTAAPKAAGSALAKPSLATEQPGALANMTPEQRLAFITGGGTPPVAAQALPNAPAPTASAPAASAPTAAKRTSAQITREMPGGGLAAIASTGGTMRGAMEGSSMPTEDDLNSLRAALATINKLSPQSGANRVDEQIMGALGMGAPSVSPEEMASNDDIANQFQAQQQRNRVQAEFGMGAPSVSPEEMAANDEIANQFQEQAALNQQLPPEAQAPQPQAPQPQAPQTQAPQPQAPRTQRSAEPSSRVGRAWDAVTGSLGRYEGTPFQSGMEWLFGDSRNTAKQNTQGAQSTEKLEAERKRLADERAAKVEKLDLTRRKELSAAADKFIAGGMNVAQAQELAETQRRNKRLPQIAKYRQELSNAQLDMQIAGNDPKMTKAATEAFKKKLAAIQKKAEEGDEAALDALQSYHRDR